jgi:hypothetical protein
MFSLTLAGGDFDDLLSDLRVGVHVIGYESGGSESFVAAAVPEPHAALVFGVGALVVGAVLRRRAS